MFLLRFHVVFNYSALLKCKKLNGQNTIELLQREREDYSAFAKTMVALVPPNPNELESAKSILASRAPLAT